MAFTTVNKGSLFMNPKIYTGNGTARTIDVGFQSDFTWIKNRGNDDNHYLFDSVRLATNYLNSDSNAAQTTGSSTSLTGFVSDGFTVGTGGGVNLNGMATVSWNWKAGTTSIPSGSSTAPTAVSINATAGFGIYAYTGTGVTGRTIAHGLNSAPKMMIVKRLNSTRDWGVYHSSLANTEHLELNNTDAKVTSNLWGNTTPTSSLIYLGNDGQSNGNTDPYIMYAFADVQGFSKMGSYVGNGSGSDGPFIFTGFTPSLIMFKSTSTTGGWEIHDNKRDPFNVSNKRLFPNLSNAEATEDYVDFVSNGFKFRTGDANGNTNGVSYSYMAFAEAPLVGTNNIPANAR